MTPTNKDTNNSELEKEIDELEFTRFHPAGCSATYPGGVCDCANSRDIKRIIALIHTENQRAVEQHKRTLIKAIEIYGGKVKQSLINEYEATINQSVENQGITPPHKQNVGVTPDKVDLEREILDFVFPIPEHHPANRLDEVQLKRIMERRQKLSELLAKHSEQVEREARKDEEIITLQWVLHQFSFDGSEQDVKYIENRLKSLKANLTQPKE